MIPPIVSTSHDEIVVAAKVRDVFAFCSDGISETFDESGDEFGSARVAEVVREHRHKSADEIGAKIFEAMSASCGAAPQTDDQTAVVVRILS